MSRYEHILVSREDGIGTVTINRPEKLNAFFGRMRQDVAAAARELAADPSVRVLVITGAGRAFCAGADLGGGGGTFDASREEAADEHRDGGGRVTLRIFECRKPVIAAVNGAAVGIGATMLLPMDVRLASADARFGFVFARRGIVAEACSSWFLPRVVGISQALEWVYTGRVFPAQEALDGGLVRSLHKAEDLLPAARALALEIAENTAPVSIALMRQMFWRLLGADHPMEAHKIDSRAIYARGAAADAKEGVMAFLEKRPARFGNRVSQDMPPFFPWWRDRPYE
jgi:enoyl-CoA hydratase/carnithine racemase